MFWGLVLLPRRKVGVPLSRALRHAAGVSPLKKGEEVEVIEMLDEGWDNPSKILV
jgi:hypothetical protein